MRSTAGLSFDRRSIFEGASPRYGPAAPLYEIAELLDEYFGAYLKRGELPGWVHAFCQPVLSKAATDEVDPRECGVDGPRRIPYRDSQFASFAAFNVFWWLVA